MASRKTLLIFHLILPTSSVEGQLHFGPAHIQLPRALPEIRSSNSICENVSFQPLSYARYIQSRAIIFPVKPSVARISWGDEKEPVIKMRVDSLSVWAFYKYVWFYVNLLSLWAIGVTAKCWGFAVTNRTHSIWLRSMLCYFWNRRSSSWKGPIRMLSVVFYSFLVLIVFTVHDCLISVICCDYDLFTCGAWKHSTQNEVTETGNSVWAQVTAQSPACLSLIWFCQ